VTRFDRSLLGTNQDAGFSLAGLPAAPAPASTGTVLTVSSDRCVFEGQNNRVTQSGHVVVEDSQARLGCDELEVRFTPARRLQDITVRGEVSVLSKADGSRMRAEQAVYQADPEPESLLITGQPVWRDREGGQELRAERFRADLKQRVLHAEEDAVLLVPRQAFNQPDLALAPGLPAAPLAARDSNQVRIAARRMNMLLPAPGRAGRSAIAEGDVVITSEADQVRGTTDRLEVREAEGTLVMDGRVVWTAGGRMVKADHLTLDRTNRMVQGKGRALFRIPLEQKAAAGGLGLASEGAVPTNLVLEVASDQFTYQSNRLVCLGAPVRTRLFEGAGLLGQLTSPSLTVRFSNRLESVLASQGVQAEHYPPGKNSEVVTNLLSCEALAATFSESGDVVALVASESVQAAQISVAASPPQTTITELTCGVLTTVLLPKAGRVDKLHAERNVVIAQGDKLGRGQNAIYTDQAYRLVLTGQPYVEYSQGRIRDADTLIWDRASGKVTGTGRYRIEWTPPAGQTNPVPLFLPKFLP
jgi:lipopolysaccharide export system protein LptA